MHETHGEGLLYLYSDLLRGVEQSQMERERACVTCVSFFVLVTLKTWCEAAGNGKKEAKEKNRKRKKREIWIYSGLFFFFLESIIHLKINKYCIVN